MATLKNDTNLYRFEGYEFSNPVLFFKGTSAPIIEDGNFPLINHLPDEIQQQFVEFNISRERFGKRVLLIGEDLYLADSEDLEDVIRCA